MKKYIVSMGIMVLFALVTVMPLKVHAQSGDGFLLDEEGNVTLVSDHAAKEEISSFQFSVKVDSAEAKSVEFQFGENSARVTEFRYDQAGDNLNVYVAGVDPLFEENTDTLDVGKIVILDGNGNPVPATVTVVEDSLQYVYGTDLKTMTELDLPGAVQVNAREEENPQPTMTPPTQEPGATATPRPTQAPGEPGPTQEPVPTQEPGPTQEPWPPMDPPVTWDPGTSNPSEPDYGEESEPESGGQKATGGARKIKTKTTARATSSPVPSATPKAPESIPEPEDQTVESSPAPEERTEETGEDVTASAEIPSEEEGQEDGGMGWIWIVVIIAIVIFAAVAVGAVVVLRKKPGQPRDKG